MFYSMEMCLRLTELPSDLSLKWRVGGLVVGWMDGGWMDGWLDDS